MKSNANNGVDRESADVRLWQKPYPYRAMLAICSDLDETPDRGVYLEIIQFLTSLEENSPMGVRGSDGCQCASSDVESVRDTVYGLP